MARIAVVTGGAGFLGGHLVKLLADGPEPFEEVRVLDLQPWDPDALQVQNRSRVRSHVGSVTDRSAVDKVVNGATDVFHVAALVDWGQTTYAKLHHVNVIGTQTVLDACLRHGVPRLVYTSTMDVVCWWNRDLEDANDEDLQVPPTRQQQLYGHYATTKAEAEKLVLAAHGSQGLCTIVVRAAGMYGEWDPHHLPNVLRAALAGSLVVRMGSPSIRFQHAYAGNVAWLHVVATRQLAKDPARCGGRAYIALDYPAENFWDFCAVFIKAAGVWTPPPWLYLPRWLAFVIAYLAVAMAWLLRPIVSLNPTITPGAIAGVLQTQSFSGNAARDVLGYSPLFSREEAQARTLAHVQAVLLPKLRAEGASPRAGQARAK